jgi:[ribosomal protein S18]-alanine N-acetyltransferase
MTAADLLPVVEIECASSQSPWSLKQFELSLNDSLVLESDNKVVGFAVMSAVLDQAELHNIAIHPEHQGIGLGAVMLDYFLNNLPNEIKSIYLEVRLSNFRAIRLYQERGFVQVGERREYYKTELGREDALLMCRDMATETP